MGHIIPKLNLNKTPQAVDSNSLVFAKNIKVNQDGSLGRDNAISLIRNLATLGSQDDNNQYLGHIVGVNGCIYFFVRKSRNEEIVGDFIYEYDEINLNLDNSPKFNVINCNWHWSGGKITGCVTTNNTNQKILTVSEYDCEELVPLKHINLSECKNTDDESIYTQNPNIPIINLNLIDYYSASIPKGVYQFFIRYKVRDGFYTNWFPATKELYSWDETIITTIQGALKYNDISKDCSKSFVFNVEYLFPEYNSLYDSFQIGFIVSSNNQIVGRSWKSFKLNTTSIYFDYNQSFIEEVLVDDFLKAPLELYNAKNVINYKNKIYTSNFIENDFNPDLKYLLTNFDISVDVINKSIGDEVVSKYLGDGILTKNPNTLDYYNRINDRHIRNFIDNKDKFKLTYDEQTIHHKHVIHLNDTSRPLYRHLIGLLRNYSSQVCGIYFEALDENDNVVKLRGTGFNQETLNRDFNWFLNTPNQTIDNDYNTFYEYFSDLTYNNSSSSGNYTTLSNESFDKEYELCNFLKYVIAGIDDNSIIYVNSPIHTYKLTKIYLDLIDVEGVESLDDRVGDRDIWIGYYRYTLDVSAGVVSNNISEINYEQVNTLLPFCEYDIYVHFVKQNGITTDGYFVKHLSINDTYINSDYDYSKRIVLYPKIEITGQFSEEYVSCFFSIVQVKNNISQLNKVDDNLYDCLDLDSLLYSTNSDFDVFKITNDANFDEDNKIYKDGKYYGSNDNTSNIVLGNSGIVKTNTVDTDLAFIIHNYELNTADKNTLIKLTPYIILKSGNTYDDYKQLNSPGFISRCSKLDFDTTNNNIFVSGLDVFSRDALDKLELKEYENSETDDKVPYIITDIYNAYSKYHLNCLTLRENLNKGIRTWNKHINSETDSDTGITTQTETLEQQWIVSVNSQNCSLIYNLPLMYKEYTRKYYNVVDDKTFTVFDNTVRSSNVDVDEVFRSIYTFDAEDYYNVPTNRGIIVNLFSINNEIFVHTEHGLFKFTDSSLLKVGDNLYSSNKEIGVSESSPFEIGIAEIVDSQYGHGGLQNKEHALITFNGYIFYDSLVRNIYSYDNQSGIQNITPPVRKIIDWFEPTDVTFVSDDANSRFFITFSKSFGNNKLVICLSYSFISKSFMSIHDIDYDYAFNSRLNTYFIKNDNLLKINYKDFGSYFNRWHSVLQVPDEVNFIEDSVGSCIDVIVNDNYEIIKYLSHIHWICSNINNYVGENPYNAAEELISNYGGDSIRVYSDQTWSDLLPIDTEQNTQQINSANSYQYPRYNNGVWTMNYFRDIKNAVRDIKNADSNYSSDDMSLIHGKYIVVRFIFGANRKNFKFENLNINFKNYEKV